MSNFSSLLTDLKKRFTPILILFIAAFLFQSCSSEDPDIESVEFEPRVLRVEADQAASEAQQITQNTQADVAEGLEYSLWASESLVADPIAIDMDDQGRAWITVTNRSGNSEFDIRGVDNSWRFESMKWETVEDRREFLHTELAPEKSDQNEWIPDRNEDGSHDWRDLAVVEEEIWKVEDTSGDGIADQSQLYISDFNNEVTDVAGGLTTFKDNAFLGVGPDMWRLYDTDNDGMADKKESLSHGYNVHIGFGGHGMSGVKVGPDGRIYWGIGDIGFNVVDQEGNRHEYPNQGAILRSDPDGSNFEVYAMGLRNTHEFDFDKYGNLISVDNDGDHPGEHERLVYLINGSDSGWRINWQFGKYRDSKNNEYKVWMDEEYFQPRFENQSAHILPPISGYHAGPAGFAYNPGTALSQEWQEHFFVMSFRGSVPNSPIYAFTLEQDGAGFELNTDEEVLTGILAVGLDFGPDGALYMTDWRDGWDRNGEGRIWKLDAPADANSEIRTETKNLIASDYTQKSEDELTDLLAHADMRVRQKAQFELVDRGANDLLLGEIESSDHQLARIHGIWGLAQIGREYIEAVEPLVEFLDDEDSETRAQTAKMLGDVRYEPAADAIIPLLTDEDARVRMFAAEALGRIGVEDAVAPIVEMLEANNDEDVYLRHAGAVALARIGDSEAVNNLEDHPSLAVRTAAVVALKRMGDPGVAQFLDDEDEYIVTNAARAISDDSYIGDAIPGLAALLDQTEFNNEPLVRRMINANLYDGTAEAAERLAQFSLRNDISDTLRVEALNTLETWDDPSIFDRVTGMYRGEISNNLGDAQEAIAGVMESHLTSSNENLKVATLNAIGNLDVTEASSQILALVHDDPSASVRSASLQALFDLNYEALDDVLAISLEDSNQEVRMKVLNLLVDSDFTPETKVALYTTTLEEGTASEKKEAYGALARLNTPGAADLLVNELEALKDGDLNRNIHLDLVLAAENSESEEVQQALEEYKAQKPEEDPIAEYRETLYGGNAQQGGRIFYSDVSAQCARCHMINGFGAEVGPDLTEVGNRLSREELLLSMIDPSAQPAAGYSSITVTRSDGETVSGIFQEETDSELTLTVSGEEVTIPKSDISNRQDAPSAMIAVGDVLSRTQLRDLVEFLSQLNGQSWD
ncbi:HEAT repeat domain-containing protein [Rhodohalobacter sulfatireducens]|uniref:HEAT repeat domain-containing protein n=1 Tax=Rhodohalobacter sulfatireducens TaxID=2911366 RepID=A0ABS9K8S9_9BACT|nr:HEAT repeat domain-containing protein [Rhodohalobacter sulfatireducens]MCG2587267.1 HEAT repeat domain-containing protein [Rhodohalobacter sulfatireducens]